jgi:deazaflavin-dependent oxidoreductase (nitroreductase family)
MGDQSKGPAIPSDLKAFNAKVIAEFRANKGQLTGQLANSKVLLLTTTGARSRRPRTTVVGYRRRGDEYVLIASNNGAPGSPAWFFNLQANPIATVEVGPELFQVRARVARPEERPELTNVVEYLERQQALTGREIPIVVLERVA